MPRPSPYAIAVFVVALCPAAAPAQDAREQPRAVAQESVVTVRIDEIDTWGRTVTFRTREGLVQTVYVPPEVAIFKELERGDLVTIRYRDSYIVQVRPGAALAPVADTTAAARADQTDPRDEVQQQLTMTVRVDSVDPASSTIVYTTQDNRKVMRVVQDRRLLDGVGPGDVVTVTYTRERAVSVEHARR